MPRRKQRVTLIHNRSAGEADHDADELARLMDAAGYALAYFDVKQCDLSAVLGKPTDLIAVAGGDGTVRRVALAARPDGPPIAILPLGTANNIAHSLGITAPLDELIALWHEPPLLKFYPIEVEAPWGRQQLIEGIGVGALAQVIDTHSGVDMTPLDARRRIAETLAEAVAREFDIRVDDAHISEPVVLLEIVTIPLVGPNLLLAPDANPADQLLDLCRVNETERAAMAEWLAKPTEGAPAPLTAVSASHVAISGRFDRVRLDDAVRAVGPESGTIALASANRPLHFVVQDRQAG
jgi:diacylglycerol kinase family enzyme